jgi:hypothetical protein
VVQGRVPRLKCFSLLLGARNTRVGGKRFSRTDEARIHAITFRYFADGFTVLNAEGGWFDPARGFIQEESRQILVCAPNRLSLRSWCGELAAALNQKELLVVEVGPASTFRKQRRALQPKKRQLHSTAR